LDDGMFATGMKPYGVIIACAWGLIRERAECALGGIVQ
jgi:hypothetical protein